VSNFIAVDLGATSGRVAIGRVKSEKIELEIAHRFSHEIYEDKDGAILWDWNLIISQVVIGIEKCLAQGAPISLAIDSWAVDYGLLDDHNHLISKVHSYRDPRTFSAFKDLVAKLGEERIYQDTGIQFLNFNTLYQLVAAKNDASYKAASKFLLIPDLLNAELTGKISTEVTNASTTQLLDVKTRNWDFPLIELAGIRKEIFTDLHEPGAKIGIINGFGALDGIKVVATASHDTASAVAGIPFGDRDTEAYISSGTWSLVGIESDTPITSKEALAANLTNELGAENTVRILKNVTGMWLLEECRRAWRSAKEEWTIPQLVDEASRNLDFNSLIDPNDPRFRTPGEMPDRIAAYCLEKGITPPRTKGEFTICILRSLAAAYKKTISEIEEVTGKRISTIHILGGGSQISLLNQLTANACGVRIKTGPVESTLFGNIAVQALSAGVVPNLQAARSLIANSFISEEFMPN
jgi:rhamnulokinase